MAKKVDFSALELRKLDMTSHYDEFDDGDTSWASHALLYTITLLLIVFIVWANFASLDEVARGDGRVIPSSEVQIIQNLEGGIIDEVLVAEGDVVKSGQTLLRMRNIQARSDFESTNQRYLGLLATVTRLRAASEGKTLTFPENVIKSAPDSVKTEKATFAANQKQIKNQRAVLEQQLSQKEQEVSEINKRLSDLKKIMALAQEERNMVAPMVERGAASQKELLQIDRQLAEQTSERNGLRHGLERAKSAVKEAEDRIAELYSSFKATAQQELSEKVIELNSIKKTLAAYEDKAARTEIHSPVHGTVKDIKFTTVGAVVRPGDPIMEVVPLEDQLIIEARISPKDRAFIHPGQRATVRLTAMDFSIYGGLDGEVTDISADTIQDPDGNSFYRVKIHTDKTQIEKNGEVLEVTTGMQASVDIITGEKTVMNYLLKPFTKAAQTAMRER